jgi:hypothetical protein
MSGRLPGAEAERDEVSDSARRAIIIFGPRSRFGTQQLALSWRRRPPHSGS